LYQRIRQGIDFESFITNKTYVFVTKKTYVFTITWRR
jgi:hypothetical protein